MFPDIKESKEMRELTDWLVRVQFDLNSRNQVLIVMRLTRVIDSCCGKSKCMVILLISIIIEESVAVRMS